MSKFFIFTLFIFLTSVTYVTAQNNCNYWYSKVDKSVKLLQPKKPKQTIEAETKERKQLLKAFLSGELKVWKPNKPDEELPGLTTKQVQKGIRCLLKLEGNKDEATFSGATRFDTSQIFEEPATVEVAALFYISYLYYRDWGAVAGAVVLTEKNGSTSAETIRKAYRYYREWFTEIKKIGLAKAREQELNPLKGKDVVWY